MPVFVFHNVYSDHRISAPSRAHDPGSGGPTPYHPQSITSAVRRALPWLGRRQGHIAHLPPEHEAGDIQIVGVGPEGGTRPDNTQGSAIVGRAHFGVEVLWYGKNACIFLPFF